MVQSFQSVLLITMGLTLYMLSSSEIKILDIVAALTKNSTLLALLIGVSFLKLITNMASDNEVSAIGEKSFIHTLVGMHFFSSVINLSALFIVADRIARNRLSDIQVRLLTRSFSSAAFWSPFFAAMGVALTYAPGASLGSLIWYGLPLACTALLITWLSFKRLDGEHQSTFYGYPVKLRDVWVPGSLVAIVLIVHHLLPEVSVLVIVALSSVLLTVAVLVNQGWRCVRKSISNHVSSYLPSMSGEMTLFISAGIFSFGIVQYVNTVNVSMVFFELESMLVIAVLFCIVVMSVIGIHPIISISLFGAFIPVETINMNIIGVTYLAGWAIGVVISPLSGMNLSISSRYAVSGFRIFRLNLPYAMIMMLITSLVLLVYQS